MPGFCLGRFTIMKWAELFAVDQESSGKLSRMARMGRTARICDNGEAAGGVVLSFAI